MVKIKMKKDLLEGEEEEDQSVFGDMVLVDLNERELD